MEESLNIFPVYVRNDSLSDLQSCENEQLFINVLTCTNNNLIYRNNVDI
jgi:hypothetical protein